MGILTYGSTISLDGYVADAEGDFQWGAPSAEVFDFHVERISEVSTDVLGRKTYELMAYWNAQPEGEDWTVAEQEFARRWQAIDKVVVSSTMTPDQLTSERDQLVPTLDLDHLRRIVADAQGEVEIFGPTTAGPAVRAGLVDAFGFFVFPVILGGGLRALPAGAHLGLRLERHRVFDNGTTYLRYARA